MSSILLVRHLGDRRIVVRVVDVQLTQEVTEDDGDANVLDEDQEHQPEVQVGRIDHAAIVLCREVGDLHEDEHADLSRRQEADDVGVAARDFGLKAAQIQTEDDHVESVHEGDNVDGFAQAATCDTLVVVAFNNPEGSDALE